MEGKDRESRIPYGVIVRRTWRRKNFQQLSVEERLLLLYFWSSPLADGSPCIFLAPIPAISGDVLIKPRKIVQLLRHVVDENWCQYDWDAGVIWLPRQVDFSEPSNGNVVKGWIKKALELPETPLLDLFLESMDGYIKRWNINLDNVSAYRSYISNRSLKGSVNPLRNGLCTPDPIPDPYPYPIPEPTTLSGTVRSCGIQGSVEPEEENKEKQTPIEAFRAFIKGNVDELLGEFRRSMDGTGIEWGTVYLKMEQWVKSNQSLPEVIAYGSSYDKWMMFAVRFIVREKAGRSRK